MRPPALALAAALALGALSLGAAQEAAPCQLATLFDHLSSIQEECCGGNECGSGYPGAEDSCSRPCGGLFEPFWDSCGEMLAAMGVGGTEGMLSFYDTCLATLYPPGQCAEDCTPSMMHCRLMEVQSACCTDPSNCPEGDPTPHECPVECALVFPFFLESCGDVLASQGGDMEEYEKFSHACARQDSIALVEYAVELAEQGCEIDLGDGGASHGGSGDPGHRRAEDDDEGEDEDANGARQLQESPYEYLGCYRDPTDNRDMQDAPVETMHITAPTAKNRNRPSVSLFGISHNQDGDYHHPFTDNVDQLPYPAGSVGYLDECAAVCSDYMYMGLQWFSECYCGNSFGNRGSEDESVCGDQGELCGRGHGFRAEIPCGATNAIYLTNAPTPSPPPGCEGFVDDPDSALAATGVTCEQVTMLGCETDLHDMQPEMAAGSLVGLICPVSCEACHRTGMAKMVDTPDTCPWDSFDGASAALCVRVCFCLAQSSGCADRLDAVNDVCCGEDADAVCRGGLPPQDCEPVCAVAFHSLVSLCGETLQRVAGPVNGARFAAFDELVRAVSSRLPSFWLD